MKKKLINITELAHLIGLVNEKNKAANHTIRYWEKEFSIIKPIILDGNRRFYDNKQIENIKYIKYLLKDKGLTIKGVKKILNNNKKVDVSNQSNIERQYLKNKIKIKSKNILNKIKRLNKHG